MLWEGFKKTSNRQWNCGNSTKLKHYIKGLFKNCGVEKTFPIGATATANVLLWYLVIVYVKKAAIDGG